MVYEYIVTGDPCCTNGIASRLYNEICIYYRYHSCIKILSTEDSIYVPDGRINSCAQMLYTEDIIHVYICFLLQVTFMCTCTNFCLLKIAIKYTNVI